LTYGVRSTNMWEAKFGPAAAAMKLSDLQRTPKHSGFDNNG